MLDPFFQNNPNQNQVKSSEGNVQTPNQQPLNNVQQNANQQKVGNQTQVKKVGSRVSIKAFLIGCVSIFMIVLGGLIIIFMNLIKDPNKLSSVGLDPATTKMLLNGFSVIFFGLIVFLGIGILIVNLYRLITIKNKPKIRYIVGTIFGFILFLFSIVLGANVLSIIKNISVENILDSDKLIMPYINLKGGPVYTRSDASLKLIAPANIFYNLNTNYFNAKILPDLGQVTFAQIQLDCGNGQNLIMDITSAQFNGSCIYFKKGTYELGLNMDYIYIPTGEKLQKSVPAGSIVFDSEITVTPNKNDLLFNDEKTEMVVGKVPNKVTFDATQVFKDLNLQDYKIIWDVNGDGTQERQNDATFTYVYKQAKLWDVNVRFPGLNNYIYTFPIRVEQSDVPVCEIIAKQINGTQYGFELNFIDNTASINEYQFDVIDKKSKEPLDSIKINNPKFNFQFPGAGTYFINATFLTDEDKKGECESDDILVGGTDFNVLYDINFKSASSPNFELANENTGKLVRLENGDLIIKEIPTIIKLTINEIQPNDIQATKKVLLDGKSILSTDNKNWETKIEDSLDHVLTIVVVNPDRGTKTEKNINIKIKRDDIIGKLKITPDTVGIEPFTVKFDASTTTLIDPADEIVYFTWNFGDGEIKKNFSESIISHTYNYDAVKDNGEYKPILTIKTKKGRELSISPENNIIVKKQLATLKIHIDSHPAQVANIGDRVNFSLEINGMPLKIRRDFGNDKTLECNGRECIQTSQIFEKVGDYKIKAQVIYENKPNVDGEIALRVR
ncbi:MAG: PKD domain-containing protein [Candidatus Absconditabacterales bacterium]